MESLLTLSVALMAGLMMTRVFKLLGWNFPDVTAFLIAGLLVGPYCLGRLGIPGLGFTSLEKVDDMNIITNTALGFIAFAIGNEFRLSQMKDIGKQALVIGVVQSVFAALLVDVVLIALHFALGEDKLPITVAITLGAIASATAPAATLMVVRQYKAKGPVTSLLLPIVALDDAVGLVVFAVSFGIAQAIKGGTLDAITVIVNPLIEIACSLLLGAVMGALLSQIEKLFYSNSNRLSMSIAFVIMTIALASLHFYIGEVEIQFSSLLVCMMLGTVFCNMSTYSADIMARVDKWTAPLFAAFFVISGAGLELGVFRYPSMVAIGVVYILTRSLGKYVGARASSKAMGCDENVVKYLGITLLPQAGVALGMVVSAQALGAEEGSMIRNVTLFGVLVYELVGPNLTKMALTAAGEIEKPKSEEANRARFAHREESENSRKRKRK